MSHTSMSTMTGLALARFTCYVKQIFTSFVTNSELLCSLRFQGWVKARNVISFLYSWIAGRRSKLGSSLNHTSPHPHTAIVGNISLFRKICVSLRSYATLWGGLEILFLYLHSITEIMERKIADVCGCSDVNAWSDGDAHTSCFTNWQTRS